MKPIPPLLFLPLLLLLSLPSAAADWTTIHWDAIVVGAGPAGIIVATRLAEANLRTLLLEGGGPSYGITGGDLSARRPPWLNGSELTRVDVPGLYKSIFADGNGLTCDGTTNAYGGCTIGGGSAINAGLFFEPPSSDWDLYFPTGWKARDMRRAIKRVHARVPSTDSPSMDGKRYLQSGYEAARRWIVDGLGYADVDINACKDDKAGVFGRPVFAYENGQRGGPVTTYLQDALGLPNFHLQTGARAVRVQRTGGTATGVWVLVDGVESLIPLSQHARVVLSAGALASPALLMTSGIGPPATLSRLSSAGRLGNLSRADWIPNTAVGAGLFDNPNTFLELSGPSLAAYTHSYLSPLPRDAALYLHARSGPYTSASQTAVFFATVPHPDNDGRTLGMQGTLDSAGHGSHTSPTTITLNIYGTSGLSSRGHIDLDPPFFLPTPSNTTYYSSPPDAPTIATFISTLLRTLPSDLTPLNIPRNASPRAIETYITTPSAYARGAVNHWSSSCAIGACVDARARVRGMRNLWVLDAAVVEPLSVNPMFGVMAVAERGVEMVLEGWRGRGRGRTWVG